MIFDDRGWRVRRREQTEPYADSMRIARFDDARNIGRRPNRFFSAPPAARRGRFDCG
jgi:hypothetical protein